MHRGRRDSVAFTVVVTRPRPPRGARHGPGRRAVRALPAPSPSRPCWRRCRSARWSAASCGWTATSPSRAPCWSRGLLWGAFVATAAALVFQGIGPGRRRQRARQPRRDRRPDHRGGDQGAFLLLLLWWRRHELDGVLDGIVYAGMVGIGFAFTENILYLAAAYNGTDGIGPGGTEALTGTFVLRCLISPFAHPLLHRLHRHRRRPRDRVAAHRRCGCWRPLVGFAVAALRTALWNASTLSGTGHFFVVYVIFMLPALPGRRGVRRLSPTLRAAGCSPRRCRTPRTAGCCPRPTSGGSSTCAPVATPGAGRASRAATQAERGDARLPAGGHRARLPPPPLPARHRARPTSRPAARSTSRTRTAPPLHLLPRTGGTHPMTADPDHDSRMLTALVRLRGALQEAPAAARRCPAPRSSAPRAPRWSTSSRTTSSRG